MGWRFRKIVETSHPLHSLLANSYLYSVDYCCHISMAEYFYYIKKLSLAVCQFLALNDGQDEINGIHYLSLIEI